MHSKWFFGFLTLRFSEPEKLRARKQALGLTRKSPENLFRANITSLYLHQRPWENKKLWNCYIPEQYSCTTSHRVSCIFFHPDFNCRPRNFTGSCLLRLAGFTAGRETIPALKTFYSFLVHSIQNLSTVVNPKRKSFVLYANFN